MQTRMNKRCIAVAVLIVIIWIDAVVENYRLSSARDTLVSNINEIKEAQKFRRFVQKFRDSYPVLPAGSISLTAIQSYERLRDDIILKDKEYCERSWKEDLAYGAYDK